MMFWYGGHWAFWEVIVMWVGMVAFWGLIVWAIYALIASVTRRPPEERGDEPHRILDQRLASGEIDVDEYQRLRDALDRPTVTDGRASVDSQDQR